MNSCFLSLLLLNLIFATPAGAQPPDAVVRQLYERVITLKPIGIPRGTDRAAIWPLLSHRLVKELETAQACQDDYSRKHRDKNQKPEFPWLEAGLFSGENEEAAPSQATVLGSEHERKSVLVHVELSYNDSIVTGTPSRPFHWPVTVVVVSEEGRFLVDDVLLSDGAGNKTSVSISSFFEGCDGSRWKGRQ